MSIHASYTRPKRNEQRALTLTFQFLRRFAHIVIVPNGYENPVVFKPDEEERFNAWLADNAGKNIYFQPNASKPRRMEKKEILQGHWLHVDIDSDSSGKSLAFNPAEKAAMAERLKASRATMLVDTGGGLQAYWELSASQPRELIERANRELIARYAPHDLGTHNIDRLLRLPGTMNWPNAKKRAKGRQPVRAQLLFDTGAVHGFSSFELAEPEKLRGTASQSGYQFGEVDISDTELPELPNALTALIKDLDDSLLPAAQDGSNSAKAWRAIVLMLKHRLKPETVKGVCLSLNWAIGLYYHKWASDHGVNVEDEVERQIRKAMSSEEPVEWPEWEDETSKQPLGDELPEVEPFELDLLPEAFKAYAEDCAELMQVPLEFIAAPLMLFAGSTIGRQVGIYPQRLTKWTEFPNFWGGLIGPPGLKKSAAIAAAGKPFRKLAEQAQRDYEAARFHFEAQKDVLEVTVKIKRKKFEKKLAELYDHTESPELPDLPTFEGDKPEPKLRRYSCAQVTQEALVELMAANPRGILVERDELVTLLQHLESQEKPNDRAMFLTGWNAKDGWGYDTIGRGHRKAEFVTISILGTTQPAKILDYTKDALRTGGGDGLLARFGLLVWPDMPKAWKNIDRKPNEFALADVEAVFSRLDNLGDPLKPKLLHFDDEAQAVFYEWLEAFEPRMRKGREHPAVTSHLMKYTKLVPGLALVCALVDSPSCEAVDAVAARRAVRWASYLESHAKRIYIGSTCSSATAAAIRLLSAMQGGDLPVPLTGRDIQRKKWSGLTSREEIAAALGVLLRRGLIISERLEGKAAPRYRLA